MGKVSDTRQRAILQGARVLITGAAGSVGADICRAFVRMGCSDIGLLDHNDHGLLRLTEEIKRTHPRSRCAMLLCDVRDRERLAVCVGAYQPDIVIHCAALKHVHSSETHPAEYVLTNLVGASNMMVAANGAGAGQFILISTDKAAAPASVLGITKRLAELHLLGFAAETQTAMQLKAVRFGNVLGSQGSVSTRFAEQIAAGGPIQITHPDMHRYFMSSDDAVGFVLDVLEQDRSERGQIFVRDVGNARSVLDLGREMMAGRPIDVEVIGLRAGEKLMESMSDEHEYLSASRLPHTYTLTPLSTAAAVSALEVKELERAARGACESRLRQMLIQVLRVHLDGLRVEPVTSTLS